MSTRMTTHDGAVLWLVSYAALFGVVARGFNVDVGRPLIVFPGDQAEIEFGFTIKPLTNDSGTWLLVGAPRANSSQDDVVHPGAVYACRLPDESSGAGLGEEWAGSGGVACMQLEVDKRSAEESYRPWLSEDMKDSMRLGQTIETHDGKALVCAPNWHYFEKRSGVRYVDIAVGLCFVSTSSSLEEFTPFSPPYDHFSNPSQLSYVTDGSCQGGISGAFSKKGNKMVVGSPGCRNWQGDTFEVRTDLSSSYYRRLNSVDAPSLGVFDEFTDISADPLYVGYATAYMIFRGKEMVVTSLPRVVYSFFEDEVSKNKATPPRVFIVDRTKKKLRIIKVLEPKTATKEKNEETLFSYFGYSLAVADVNGDGLEDLVVGAPLYHNSSHYDQGAIYVFMQIPGSYADGQAGSDIRMDRHSRHGDASGSRFGSAIAAVGDLDGDGFTDIAVGAPYRTGGGAVYLYYGSGRGLAKYPTQIIEAEVVGGPPWRSFGFSLATAQEADAGGSPEKDRGPPLVALAVGSPFDDAVVLFRTLPILSVNWTLEVLDDFDVTVQACEYNGLRYTCTDVRACFAFSVTRAATQGDREASREFLLTVSLDAREQEKRLWFQESGKPEVSQSLRLPPEDEQCTTFKVLVKQSLENQRPFQVRGSAALHSSEQDKATLSRHLSTSATAEILIAPRCEASDHALCQSDIQLSYNITEHYTLNEAIPLTVVFTVHNHQETAYFANLLVDTSNLLVLRESWIDSESVGRSERCEPENDVSSLLKCQLGDYILEGQKVTVKLVLDPSLEFFDNLYTLDNFFHLKVNVTSYSVIVDPAAAYVDLQVPIKVEGLLSLSKGPITNLVVYNSSSYYKSPSEATLVEELGEEVVHEYRLYNPGETEVVETRVLFSWEYIIAGKHLLYLVEPPTLTNGGAKCEQSNFVDPENKFYDQVEEDLKKRQRRSKQTQALTAKSFGLQYKPETSWATMRCSVRNLEAKQESTFIFKFRLVFASLAEMDALSPLKNASSTALAEILLLPLGTTPPPSAFSASATTDVSFRLSQPELKIPWWLLLAAVCLGLLVFLILFLILWKCGFFRRKKKDEQTQLAEEDQKWQNPGETQSFLRNNDGDGGGPEGAEGVTLRTSPSVDASDEFFVERTPINSIIEVT
ncbi:integrin alpha-8-like [Oratosquilla oratoria]|uniref:integrin alpha-8-like n=1 Tax=Oratosquilla oratoria TaxID=337810 RepID=UPI003F76A802